MEALREHEQEQAKLHRMEMQAWKRRHDVWKAKRDRILADARKPKAGDCAAAEAELAALGQEPEAPPSTDRIVTEPTFEGLTKLFANGEPSLGLFSDEGGQFLGGHAMSSNNRQKTRAAFNDSWQANPIRRTRAGDGHATLYGRRLAVHLMAQPTVARAFMAEPLAADTGFLPRFLICEPPSTIGTRLHETARNDDRAILRFNDRLRFIVCSELPVDAETRELQPRCLQLSEGARQALVRFSDSVERSQGPDGDMVQLTGTASKTAEQAARIAGVLTLWQNLEAEQVEPIDMTNAIELARFYLLEAARLADAAQVSAEVTQAEKLKRWLLEGLEDPEVMVRDVVRCGPNSLRESPKAQAAMKLLEKHGWLVQLDAGTVVRGSARSEAWRIVRPSSNET